MKIRNGFVSNSSSSSFLVFFPNEIKTKDELFNLLWTEKNSERFKKQYNFINKENNRNIETSFTNYYSSINMSFEKFQEESTNIIFKDIENQGPNNYINALRTLFYDDYAIEFKNMEDIRNIINDYNNINNKMDNFKWDQPNSEQKYDDLQNQLDDLHDVEYLKSHIDEIDELIKKHKNNIFYTFQFSDENGKFYSALEHGGIFNELTCYVESHH